METFTILSSQSQCITKTGYYGYSLSHNIQAYYHEDYKGGMGRYRIPGTIENLICTLKNDITPYSDAVLRRATTSLAQILTTELPQVLQMSHFSSLRVCVIPRAKNENHYNAKQKLFRQTIQSVVQKTFGFSDGTMDIIRHKDTATTHLARCGNGGAGRTPYIGITRDTCFISNDVIGKDILLIDDLYTKTVNIDEDCIQALYDKGARTVLFYSIGKTVSKY